MLKSIIYLNNSDVKGINSVLSIFVKSLQKQGWFVCVSEKEKNVGMLIGQHPDKLEFAYLFFCLRHTM